MALGSTCADLRITDRKLLKQAEVASLLAIDPRIRDHAIDDGTIPAVRIGGVCSSRGDSSWKPSVSRPPSRHSDGARAGPEG